VIQGVASDKVYCTQQSKTSSKFSGRVGYA